jgi:choline dehydrogenase-like flavoprotein
VSHLEWKRTQDGRSTITRVHAEGRGDGAALDAQPLVQIEVEAEEFILSGGAIQTPLLLQKSQILDPGQWVGSRLHLHPGCVAAGVFEEPVKSWTGIPQSWECTEFLDFEVKGDQRIWLVGGAAHPAGMASILPGLGAEHRLSMQQTQNLAPISVMLHDITRGTVRSDITGATEVDYQLCPEDLKLMAFGLVEAGRILFAAGAKEVLIPSDPLIRARTISELELAQSRIAEALLRGRLELVSVHPMSSVWMAPSAQEGPVNPQGRLYSVANLRIADTSLYPTSLGVPPQITTYMAGIRVADFLRS